MKRCPFCLKEIKDEAIKCRYCQKWLNSNQGEDMDKSKLLEHRHILKETVTKNVLSNKPSMFFDIIHSRLAFNFWLFLIGIVLLIISLIGGTNSSWNFSKMTMLPFVTEKDFNIFLRLCIFCIAMYFAFLKYKDKRLDIIFLFIVVGVIFNPFFPFRFDNDFQRIIEFFTAGFFGYFSHKEYQKIKKLCR